MTVWIPPWVLPELATFFLEKDLEFDSDGDIEFEHNARVPDVDGYDRQVDVVIRYRHKSALFIHIFEVEDRSEPFGIESLDELLGKARSLGANATTVITTGGYTESVIKKLTEQRERPKVRAIHLSPPQAFELTSEDLERFSRVPTFDETSGISDEPIELKAYAYRNVVDQTCPGFVFIGNIRREFGEYLICNTLENKPAGTGRHEAIRAFTRPGSLKALGVSISTHETTITVRTRPEARSAEAT